MKVDEIRDKYLSYFTQKDHTAVSSDSLVPRNDPTLLFTGAGMNQFKEYFLGLKKDMTRATSSQKCLRTGDLEEVGKTAYHHSFFEMLGNFSFGDYFKRDAIIWAWDFLTTEVKISKDRLRVTVHTSDDEAYAIWKDEVKIREDWIYRMGDKSNFWPSNAPKDGPNGPCGPCSEIYYDMADDPSKDAKGLESSRFAEVWNLVFTQYDRQEDGTLEPLANKNIDTGMGLERLACVLQGKKNNFEIDIFETIQMAVKDFLKIHESKPPQGHLNAICDHARAIVFTIADGVVPSNEGRGYVVRKLIRRALWHAHQVVPAGRLDDPFLHRMVPVIIAVMKYGYPELQDAEASIAATVCAEEERFLDTLDTGLKILENRLNDLKKSKGKVVPGEIVFELYDTYGFPDELTRAIAESRGFSIDQKGFDENMQKQRERAKEASQISASIFSSTELEKTLFSFPATRFTGYEDLQKNAKVLFSEFKDHRGIIVLDQTPFYGESGGQVGDRGAIEGSHFKAQVVDTQKKDAVFIHVVEVKKGNLKAGSEITAKVDPSNRARIMRNHTATHLLHSALRKTLGKQVRQMGSLVSSDKLRFDYSWPNALTHEQTRKIEDEVNLEILKNTRVIKECKSLKDAKDEGAIAFFGEKYSNEVRVVDVQGFSKELCGGTHCDSTGQIGSFVITSDSSIASGTRRIEGMTGNGTIEYLRTLRSELEQVAALLKTSPMAVMERVQKLQENIKKLEKEKKHGMFQSANPKSILQKARQAGDVRFANYRFESGAHVQELRKLSDELRSTSMNTVYFLGSENEEKIHFVIGLSPDLQKTSLDARKILKELMPLIDGSGGGRKEMVQGGARNVGQYQNDWDKIVDKTVNFLRQKEV